MKISLVPNVIAEEYPSKVAASFDTREQAERATSSVLRAAHADTRQLQIIAPDDPAAARKLQPESATIPRTWVRTHCAFGVFGLLLGALLAAAAIQWGPVAMSASPLYTGITLVWVTTLSCLITAGAVTLRMDHDRVLNHVFTASAKGQHTLVAHARTVREKRRFARLLRRRAETMASSL